MFRYRIIYWRAIQHKDPTVYLRFMHLGEEYTALGTNNGYGTGARQMSSCRIRSQECSCNTSNLGVSLFMRNGNSSGAW